MPVAAAGALLVRRALSTGSGDPFARLFSRRAVGGGLLLLGAVALVAVPYVVREATKRCVREELVNVFVGRVSQAQRICVEYGDGSTDAVRSATPGVRFSPPEPARDAPFTVVIYGLEPGEQVRVSISPVGIALQPATLVADRAGEARTDFRIPSGGSPTWAVVAKRAGGETLAVAVPFPAAADDPLGLITQPPFAPPSADPAVTVSTCSPTVAPVRTPVRCTFVGLTGDYAAFSRTQVSAGTTVDLRWVSAIRADGRVLYVHTYDLEPGDWLITAATPTGTTATARFTVTRP